jgi:hypothetical protein
MCQINVFTPEYPTGGLFKNCEQSKASHPQALYDF